MASLKVEFATVRELEKKTSKIFIYGGAGVVAGIILIFMFPPIGFLITALSLAAVLGGMIYVGMLAKEPSQRRLTKVSKMAGERQLPIVAKEYTTWMPVLQ